MVRPNPLFLALVVTVGAAGSARAQEATPSVPEQARPTLSAPPLEPYVPSIWAPRTFTVGGFAQTQVGVFVSPDTGKIGAEDLPTDHGDKLGDLSMARNTFQVELNWQPHTVFQMHAVIRGVLGPPLPADRQAQVPEQGYKNQPDRSAQWVAEHYYNDFDLREFYLQIQPTPILDLRVGRQLVAWGETGNARLLDVVNPVDATWHFGALESFEDQRLPLWMVRASVEIPILAGSLDLVWVPMVPFIERSEDVVTTPLTFVGAWGLPPPPLQRDESVGLEKFNKKDFDYPHRFLKDSRVGGRWKGSLGPWLGYSLMYYWTHQTTPPIPKYYIQPFAAGDKGIDLYLDFPRQHVVGLSLEANLPYPAATMLKFEATYEPDRTYPVTSDTIKAFESLDDGVKVYFDCADATDCDRTRKHTLNYAVTMLQPFYIRAVNPEQPFILTLQWSDSVIFGYDRTRVAVDPADPCDEPGECLLEAPGYDSTILTRHKYQLVAGLSSTFLNGMITPRIVGAWLPRQDGNSVTRGSGFLSVSASFAFDDHWRLAIALNEFFGTDPYSGVGMFRDRDEVNLTVRYQF